MLLSLGDFAVCSDSRACPDECLQHDNSHPAVSITFCSTPLVYSRKTVGNLQMDLRVSLLGLVQGCTYKIIAQEIHRGTASVIWQSEKGVEGGDVCNAKQTTVELWTVDANNAQHESVRRFGVSIFDTHQGLSGNEMLLATRDVTLALSASARERGARQSNNNKEENTASMTHEGGGRREKDAARIQNDHTNVTILTVDCAGRQPRSTLCSRTPLCSHLPPGWYSHFDEERGCDYFFNPPLGKSSWDSPQCAPDGAIGPQPHPEEVAVSIDCWLPKVIAGQGFQLESSFLGLQSDPSVRYFTFVSISRGDESVHEEILQLDRGVFEDGLFRLSLPALTLGTHILRIRAYDGYLGLMIQDFLAQKNDLFRCST